jgi:perosamine synthetase
MSDITSSSMRIRDPSSGTTFGEQELAAIKAVFESGDSLSWGRERETFEDEFRTFVGAKHAISVNSCTSALNLCAQLLRLGPEDEVICTPQTFWATVAALVQRDVKIRFGDIDPFTLNLSAASVSRLITRRTRAIYVVHYAGNPVDMQAIRDIARPRGIPIVEDCAHATGAMYQGKPIGDGDLCCFSFQSLKNMSTLGEGGMLTTSNDSWAEEARRLRIMGVLGVTTPRTETRTGVYEDPQFALYDHSTFPPISRLGGRHELSEIHEIGTKCYLTSVQAAVGRVQLKKLPKLNARRASIAQRYSNALEATGGLRPIRVLSIDRCAWHLYPCFLDPRLGVKRNDLIDYLQRSGGIEIVLRYWPLHLNPIFQRLGCAFGDSPECERVWFEQQVNLPIAPSMTDEDVGFVVEALNAGIQRLASRSSRVGL